MTDGTRELGATDFAMLSLRSSKRAAWVMAPLFASAAVFQVVLVLADRFAVRALLSNGFHRSSAMAYALLVIAELILQALASAAVAVAVHRYVLLGEVTRGLIWVRHRHTIIFASWLLAFSFFDGLYSAALTSLLGRTFLLVLILKIPVVLVAIRLALVFPAIAVEEPVASWTSRLQASWDRTRNHFWVILLSLIIAALPLMAAAFAALVPALLVMSLRSVDGSIDEWTRWLGWTDQFMKIILAVDGVAAVVVGAAVASWIYKAVIVSAAETGGAEAV